MSGFNYIYELEIDSEHMNRDAHMESEPLQWLLEHNIAFHWSMARTSGKLWVGFLPSCDMSMVALFKLRWVECSK